MSSSSALEPQQGVSDAPKPVNTLSKVNQFDGGNPEGFLREPLRCVLNERFFVDGRLKSPEVIQAQDVYALYVVLCQRNLALDDMTAVEMTHILDQQLWPAFPFTDLPCLHSEDEGGCLESHTVVPEKLMASFDKPDSLKKETRDGIEALYLKASTLIIVGLINEGLRQGVEVWAMLKLHDQEVASDAEADALFQRFKKLFYTAWFIFSFPEQFRLNSRESVILVHFFIYVFQGLEQQLIRKVCMPICSLPSWAHLSDEQRDLLLQSRPELRKTWKAVYKKQRNLEKRCSKGLKSGRTSLKANGNGLTLSERFFLLERDAAWMAVQRILRYIEVDLSTQMNTKNFLGHIDTTPATFVEVFCGTSLLPKKLEKENRRLDASLMSTKEGLENGDSSAVRNEEIDDVSADSFLLCERFLELLIDLMSQLPTRRFFRPIFMSLQFLPRLRLSRFYRHSEGALIRQLASILAGYEVFELDDATGEAVEYRDLETLHYKRLKDLQLLFFRAFSDVPSFKEMALGPVARYETATALRELFQPASVTVLLQIADALHLVDALTFAQDALKPVLALCGSSDDVDLEAQKETTEYATAHTLLVEVLVNHLHRRPNHLACLNQLPLFPTEALIWDPHIVPTEHYRGDFALALPKLNLQFLTIRDYLARNFHLFRLESTYEIREDLQDAIWRMQPVLGYGSATASSGASAVLQTQFRGASRMAVPITHFAVVLVKPPAVGSLVPAEVRAEIVVDLQRVPREFRDEWDSLRQFDVMFLAAIQARNIEPITGRLQDFTRVTEFPEKMGVVGVRGCEIVEVLDEEGQCFSESSGMGGPRERVAFGNIRTYRVLLDPYQYQKDLDETAATAKGTDTVALDVYDCANLLIRRKPAENNFKSILETIRQLMNDVEHAVIPSWLHDLFLGYGDPTLAQYFNFPQELTSIDFCDTFFDVEHLKASFQSVDRWLGPADLKGDVTMPKRTTLPASPDEPIFRIKFTKSNDEKPDSLLPRLSAVHPPEGEAVIEMYSIPPRGPYPQCVRRRNTIRFTPTQVEAIRSGVNPGLTLIVGPPGTGKTDTAVQIAYLLHKNFPSERILLVAHSNQALNDLFEKIASLDIDERFLLRLGMGEKELNIASDRTLTSSPAKKDFSKWGRVNYMLQRRLTLLQRIDVLAASLGIPGDFGTSCETAIQFFRLHVIPRIIRYRRFLKSVGSEGRGLRLALRDMRDADRTSSTWGAARLGQPILQTDLETTETGYKVSSEEPGAASVVPSHEQTTMSSKAAMESTGDELTDDRRTDPKLTEDEPSDALTEPIEDAVTKVSVEKIKPLNSADSKSWQAMKPIKSIEDLDDAACESVNKGLRTPAQVLFPFTSFFSDVSGGLFQSNAGHEAHAVAADRCFEYLEDLYLEIKDCQAFELLRNLHDRAEYLMTRQAKIIAMTCTHASLVRRQLVDMHFRYDSLIMEEAAQVLEVEAFVPMVLQRAESSGTTRLKRVILLGDHHQLPPVVKNRGFQQYGHLDQSMFTRFVRLQVPYIQLEAQGRCRASLRQLFSWRYTRPPLGDLPIVSQAKEFALANPGIRHEFQLIDVRDFEGRGEFCPQPHFYQNLGEAEYAVGLFMYMRLLGYPAESIAILTTYNGQKALIKDILQKRCVRLYENNTICGECACRFERLVSLLTDVPGIQRSAGRVWYQQWIDSRASRQITQSLDKSDDDDDNDSCVVPGLAASNQMSFCPLAALFGSCKEIEPIFKQLITNRSTRLELVLDETTFSTTRRIPDHAAQTTVHSLKSVYDMWDVLQTTARRVLQRAVEPDGPPPMPSTSAEA